MADELTQAKNHLDAASAALNEAEAAPDIGLTQNSTTVEAVDLEPAAEAAKHLSDNELEIARVQAEAAIEQAHIAADVSLGLAAGAGVEDRLADILDRLGRLEGRAHDHNDEEETEIAGEASLSDLLSSEGDSIEAIEEDAADAPPAPDLPDEPAETKRAPGFGKGGKLYFGKKRS